MLKIIHKVSKVVCHWSERNEKGEEQSTEEQIRREVHRAIRNEEARWKNITKQCKRQQALSLLVHLITNQPFNTITTINTTHSISLLQQVHTSNVDSVEQLLDHSWKRTQQGNNYVLRKRMCESFHYLNL